MSAPAVGLVASGATGAEPPPTPARWARLKLALLVLALLGLAAFLLTPNLRTGYLSDDVLTSLTPGMLRYTGESLPARIVGLNKGSMKGGRFYPLHWVAFASTFCAFRDVYWYKGYINAHVLLNIALFIGLIRRVGGSPGLACLAAALTAMLIQFRAYHDPILSFFALVQLSVSGTLLSLLALERHLDGHRGPWLLLSVMLYAACLLLYENSYPFLLFHATLIARRRPGWRRGLATFVPFGRVAAVCLLLTFVVRSLRPETSGVYELNPEPTAVASTLARQTTSALPLSYFAADPDGLFADVKRWAAFRAWIGRPDALAVASAAFALCLACLGRRRDDPRPPEAATLAMLGALMTVLPAVMIALTVRYQKEIQFGKGYIQVYFQYFGVALLAATALWAVLGRLEGRGRGAWALELAVAAAVGATTGVTYRANDATAVVLVSPPGSPTARPASGNMEGQYHDRRVNLEAALRAGLMDNVPEYARVLTTGEYNLWYDQYFGIFFYAANSSKLFAVTYPSTVSKGLASPEHQAHEAQFAKWRIPDGPPYIVRDESTGFGSGFVVLSQMGRGPLRLFVRHPGLDRGRSPGDFAVVGTPRQPGDPAPFVRRGSELRLLRRGRDWALYTLRSEAAAIDPGSLRVEFDAQRSTRLLATAGRGSPLR